MKVRNLPYPFLRGQPLKTYSNSQRKNHQIAQICYVEPQKRQYTTAEVGLHLFEALT